MKKAIVTGATGFVGIHLADELLSHDIEVIALCRENSPNLNRLPSSIKVVFDINDLPAADVFYHLAWECASGPGRGDAVLQTNNVNLTLSALLAAHRLNCKKFIALGTIYENLEHQIKASCRFSGSDFYILSKAYAHAISNQLAFKLGIDFVWSTICHPIGRLIKPEQMMAFTISNLLSGTKPSFGPAKTLYDIVAVEDVAYGLYLMGENKLTRREYYIGSASPKPLHLWLEETLQILGTDTPIGIGERPDDGLMFKQDWFDIAPLKTETGYMPKVSFSDAVKCVADWIR